MESVFLSLFQEDNIGDEVLDTIDDLGLYDDEVSKENEMGNKDFTTGNLASAKTTYRYILSKSSNRSLSFYQFSSKP